MESSVFVRFVLLQQNFFSWVLLKEKIYLVLKSGGSRSEFWISKGPQGDGAAYSRGGQDRKRGPERSPSVSFHKNTFYCTTMRSHQMSPTPVNSNNIFIKVDLCDLISPSHPLLNDPNYLSLMSTRTTFQVLQLYITSGKKLPAQNSVGDKC